MFAHQEVVYNIFFPICHKKKTTNFFPLWIYIKFQTSKNKSHKVQVQKVLSSACGPARQTDTFTVLFPKLWVIIFILPKELNPDIGYFIYMLELHEMKSFWNRFSIPWLHIDKLSYCCTSVMITVVCLIQSVWVQI